ncbi:hypothetical protein PLEOSDRAFT_1049984 [Pleurotus ostreatus PC15]|uniref:DUF6534 domain-containing protein n=1 Tax=Pleurotus ostreatus (strain PC15) TaxID=1137138 RepID=A0A067N4K9_PLEO1|nr:hypothetical protein PLEOSDRAFT_1049984 [Pleurotus ostreatus PC15]
MDSNSNVGMDMSGVFGPIYWEMLLIDCRLGGITALQAYNYFPRHSDRLIIQLVVCNDSFFDFVSSALVVQSVYYYLVPHFGSLSPLASITPELSAECLLSTIITFISQLYFVAQLYAVTKTGRGSWMVPVSVAVCAVLAFACTSVMFVYDHRVLGERHHNFSVSNHRDIFFGLAKGFGALTDIIATIAMCILLSGAKTGIQQTNGLLKSLIHYVVHRGVLVTLIQMLLLIMFYAAPSRLYWLAFHVNVTKLYANTFCELNSRDQLKQKHAHTVSTSYATYSKGRYASNNATHDKDTETQVFHPLPTLVLCTCKRLTL